jgi:hypothetical protein
VETADNGHALLMEQLQSAQAEVASLKETLATVVRERDDLRSRAKACRGIWDDWNANNAAVSLAN